ncbi:MAG: ABC transporter substrate-binding protein [Acidimicrobiales bacterium]|nr:ABC transporter substrate-binding protein [Acidimicrobiales bacterium]
MAMALERGRMARLAVAVTLTCLVAAMLSMLARAPAAGAATSPKSLKVLMGASAIWPTGLDPAPSTTGAANAVMLDAIYGDLFSETPQGKVVPDLASGYTESNGGQTWTIHIRPGVTFSDGTPFNAQAVAFNIKRDLEPQYACACADNFPVTSITAPNASSVVINLSEPFAPFIEGFIDTPPNWIVSPTALQTQGEQSFKFKPVGAGPFMVKTDNVNSELVVTRNPHYWKKGQPKLSSITFSVIGSDASAYDAMLGGQANVDFGMDTLPIATQARKKFNVHEVTSETEILEINTTTAPFNNLLAREAIFYATDSKALMKGFFGTTKYLDQSIDGPGGLFYEQHVPGYRTYDLAKAKALVKQLGGLHVNLLSLGYESGFLGSELTTAIQAQWAKAGITSTISPVGSIASLVQDFKHNSWEAVPESTGGLDPSLAPGLAWRFAGNGPFTCCKDPQIDQLIKRGLATQDLSARRKIYQQLWSYMAKQSDALVLFADPAPIGGWTLVDRNVRGESLSNNNVSTIDWGGVSLR